MASLLPVRYSGVDMVLSRGVFNHRESEKKEWIRLKERKKLIWFLERIGSLVQ